MNISEAAVDALVAKRKRLIFAPERSTPVTRCAFFKHNVSKKEVLRIGFISEIN
jgi:hypothetical protein